MLSSSLGAYVVIRNVVTVFIHEKVTHVKDMLCIFRFSFQLINKCFSFYTNNKMKHTLRKQRYKSYLRAQNTLHISGILNQYDWLSVLPFPGVSLVCYVIWKCHLFDNCNFMNELAETECTVIKIFGGPKIVDIDEDESNEELSCFVGIVLLCLHFR